MGTAERGTGRDRFVVGVIVAVVVLAVVGYFLTRDDEDDSEEPAAAPISCTGQDRLVVPSQKLTARMLPLTLDGEALNPPDDPAQVGWWRDSARPGRRNGQTLVTGHTVHSGEGALNNIGALKRGQRIKVCFRGKLVTYRTTRVVEMSKEQVAARAQALFGQQRKDGRLVLVTCTDWVGPGDYRSNLIVFGMPISA